MYSNVAANLLALSLPITIHAEENPVPALFLAAIIAVLLWFGVVQARRRDERRARQGRGSDTWSRRPPRY